MARGQWFTWTYSWLATVHSPYETLSFISSAISSNICRHSRYRSHAISSAQYVSGNKEFHRRNYHRCTHGRSMLELIHYLKKIFVEVQHVWLERKLKMKIVSVIFSSFFFFFFSVSDEYQFRFLNDLIMKITVKLSICKIRIYRSRLL